MNALSRTSAPLRTFSVNAESSVPPFEQLRDFIADGAHTGRLAAGTRLPAVRPLATQLGIAANTVARAYKELEAAGVVVTAGRAGTTIAANDGAQNLALDAAREFARTARAAGLKPTAAERMLRGVWNK